MQDFVYLYVEHLIVVNYHQLSKIAFKYDVNTFSVHGDIVFRKIMLFYCIVSTAPIYFVLKKSPSASGYGTSSALFYRSTFLRK